MGDRVAIEGGKTVGRDHFPFPVEDLSAADIGPSEDTGTVYPFGLTLAQACIAFFLVKTWQIDVNITNTPPLPGTPVTTTGTYYASAGAIISGAGATLSPGFDREPDLVVPRMTSSADNTTTSNFTLFADADEYSNPTDLRIGFRADLFYPMFAIDAESSNGPSTAWPAVHPGATLSWLGSLFNLYAADPGWGGTIDVYPSEYWPYATKAGLPVWDTATGAQLRDPFS